MPEVFKYGIKPASSPSWMDITGLINSSETKITDALCTTAWKSATNTASFSIRYSDKTLFSSVLAAILEAADENERIDVRITSLNTGYIVFSGFLDVSSLKIASGKIPSSLSLSARDYIADLDKAASINLVLEDQSVRTIVARLLEEAVGYSGSLPSDIPDSIKIPYLVITSDDDDTYRTIIDTLLFESCGYVLYRNPATSGYEIRKIVPDEEPERIVHYVVSDTLSTKTGIFDNDGVRVEYPTVSQRVGQVLYSADLQPTLEDGELKGEEILPGQYYPSDGDISPVYQEYDSSLLDRAYQTGQSRKQSDDISLLYVKNARININPGEGFDFPVLDNIGMPSNPVFYPRKAWVLLRNNTDSALNLLTFTIEGLAVYKSRLNKLTMPAESENPEAYETRFIFSSETASAFGTFLLNFRRISSAVTTWTEKEPVSHLGEKVIVRHKGTEISQAYVVVQINDESFSGGVRCFRVTAVSVSGYSEYSWVEESSSGSIVGKQIATDGQQYYYSSSYETLQGGTWLDKQISAPGKALWTRRKITYTDGSVWIGDPVCSAAKPGADGKSSQYFYKYTKENNPDSWQEGASLFVHGNRLLGYRNTVFSSGMGEWQDHVPEGEQYRDDFLWTKIVHPDGTYDIIPPAKQGEPAYGLEIIAEPTGYQLTSRGVVKEDPAVINLSLKRHYVTYAAVWALSPENNSDITLTVDEEDHDKAVVSIRQGSKLKSFTVAVDVGEHGVKASLMVSGIPGGVAVTHYFGIYPKDEADARPSYHKDTKELDFGDAVFPDYLEGEGDLIPGDYVLFMTDVITGEGESQTTTTELIPYYYTGAGSVWAMVDEYTPNYSEIMGSIIGDVTTRPDMPATVGALYGFFQNLAAQTAFINKLFAQYLRLEDDGAIFAGGYNGDGNNPDGIPGFHLSAQGLLKAVAAYLVDAVITGTFETSDNNGIILKSQKEQSLKEITTSISDAFIRVDTATGNVRGLSSSKAVRFSDSSKYFRSYDYVQWYTLGYAHSQSSIIYSDVSSSLIGGMILGYTSVSGQGVDTYKEFDVSNCPSGAHIVVTCGFNLISSSSVGVSVRVSSLDPVESLFTGSGTLNSWGEICGSFITSADRIRVNISCTKTVGITLEVAYVTSQIKKPSGPLAYYFVEQDAFEPKSDWVPLASVSGLPEVRKLEYTGSEGTIAYSGPEFTVYNSSGSQLGSSSDLQSLLSYGFQLYTASYPALIADISAGEYAASGESEIALADGRVCSVSRVICTGSGESKAVQFYGSESGNPADDSLLFTVSSSNGSFVLIDVMLLAHERGVTTASMFPASDSLMDIGSQLLKYRNIFADTVSSDLADVKEIRSDKNPQVIYTDTGNSGTTVAAGATFANNGFRLWDDGFIILYYTITMETDTSGTLTFLLNGLRLQFKTSPAVMATSAIQHSGGLAGNGNFAIVNVGVINTTNCYLQNDGGEGEVFIRVEGVLADFSLEDLKSNLGIS